MNGRILLLDDRATRQTNSLLKHKIDLKDYDLIDNKIEEKFNEIIINFDTFLTTISSTYDVIIAHESKFRATENDKLLRDFCFVNNIKLVYYSGGISSTFYNIKNGLLYINSNDLYSEKLSLFYEDYKNKISSEKLSNEINLLILAYGNKWKTNILLNAIENLNIYLNLNIAEEIIEYDDFKKKTFFGIILENKLINVVEPDCSEDGLIKDDIKTYIENLKKEIMREVYNGLY